MCLNDDLLWIHTEFMFEFRVLGSSKAEQGELNLVFPYTVFLWASSGSDKQEKHQCFVKRTDMMYLLDCLLYMNVYMSVYNIYRNCTQELCQKDSCFQTAFQAVNVGAVSSYCLVPTGGHWSTWETVILLGGLVPNASHLAVPKLQKIPYLTHLCVKEV